MTLRRVRIGSFPDMLQYDDADYDCAIETDQPIRTSNAPVNPNDMLRLSDLPGAGTGIESTAVITDHAIVRGDGGARNVQDSGITISDTDDIDGISELRLVPKAASTGAEGTIFYNSADNGVYVATE